MIGGAKGIGIGLDFGIGNWSRPRKTEKLDPSVKEALVGVWVADQNTNDSPTRNIIKNKLSNRGGDFEILNAAYELNSGYGLYATNFTKWSIFSQSNVIKNENNFLVNGTLVNHWISYIVNRDVPSFKVNITFPFEMSINYSYISNGQRINLSLNKGSGIYILPANESNIDGSGFQIINFNSSIDYSGLTIEQIPDYQGSFVSDGVDDIIVSQKNTADMLTNGNEVTIISMMSSLQDTDARTNFLSSPTSWMQNTFKGTSQGKLNIAHYKADNYTNTTGHSKVVESILGDKADITIRGAADASTASFNKFGVNGYITSGMYVVAKAAWYWTVMANKVLTIDQINQVIAYYNLDKYVEPDTYYDVKKQGLTNDNHTEFSDKLIDYSGNGKDMQLYNFGWKLDSGIGKYEEDFNLWTPQSYVADSTHTSNSIHITNIYNGNAIIYTYKATKAIKVKVTGIKPSYDLKYTYMANSAWRTISINNDGIYNLPAGEASNSYNGFRMPLYKGECNITIEQIPEYEGALVSDGVDDYGLADTLPIYKDYTVVFDRDWIDASSTKSQCLAFKGQANALGSYSVELNDGASKRTYSFGTLNGNIVYPTRGITYQSKYSYNGTAITSGNNLDGNVLYLFRSRDSYPNYASAAIRSFITFPYSMSEFLIERQLKKRELGTLYPNMLEFRPTVKSNIDYQDVIFRDASTGKNLVIGKYYSTKVLAIYIKPKSSTDEVSSVIVNGIAATFYSYDSASGYYRYNIDFTKSPQNINVTITPKTI